MKALLFALVPAMSVTAAQAAPAHRAPTVHRAAPRDWSQTVTQSPAGGFVLGDPKAPVQVVEFGSYTCPHCAHFSTDVLPQLIQKYVRTGQASYEFRNAVRDGYDLVAAVLTRCVGAKGFFPASSAVFASQPDWMQQAINYEQAHANDLDKETGTAKGAAIARASGLDSLFAARGLTPEHQLACLGDQAELAKIVAMTKDAFDTRQLTGTPGIFVNGTLLVGGPDWAHIDAAVAAALKK